MYKHLKKLVGAFVPEHNVQGQVLQLPGKELTVILIILVVVKFALPQGCTSLRCECNEVPHLYAPKPEPYNQRLIIGIVQTNLHNYKVKD